MARLTCAGTDPSMVGRSTMVPCTVRYSRRPRPIASTPCRGLSLTAAVCAIALLALLVALTAAAPAAAAATAVASPVSTITADAVVVAPHDFADADSLIEALASDGARPAIVYLPRTALARISPATAVRLRSLGFAVLRAHAKLPSGAPSETAAALAALDSLADGAAAAAARDRPAVPADLPSLGADLKLADTTGASGQTPPPGLAAPAFLDLFATVQTASAPAAYAAGSVAVSIIFPQSTRTAAGHSESWKTPDPDSAYDQPDPEYPRLTARQGYIVAEVSKTLLWWQSQAPSAVHLTFVIPPVGKVGAPQQVAVAREPITIASTKDALWRHPIMAALHHKAASAADSPPPERAYDIAVRKANGTDWAFTLYCVDSLNTTSGEFPDGAFAYVYDVFGPYAVTTWDNDGYGPGLYDGVLAHEIGHIFGALDEYAPPAPGYPSTGNLYSGYLWVQNKNAVVRGTTNDVCIMRGGSEGIAAYEGQPYDGQPVTYGGICPSTRGQIGWRDANANGIPDVVDTTPIVALQPPTLDGVTATVAGVARENPWPPGHNARGRAFAKGISVLVPHDVQYIVDGGAWTPVSTSGTGATENFRFTTPAFTSSTGAPTRHVVTVQATTGNAAQKSIVAWTAPTPVTLTLSRGVAAIALGAKVKLTVSAADTDALQYPIGFLPGVTVGPLGAAATTQKTVTTGVGGHAAVAFAPRFTTTFEAAFQPGAQSPFEAATSVTVSVAVHALLTARARVAAGARVIHVTGTFRPVRAAVPLVLQLFRAGVWKAVAHTRTTARSTFRLVYAAHAGVVRLRVRFAGDARNAAAVRALPELAVS